MSLTAQQSIYELESIKMNNPIVISEIIDKPSAVLHSDGLKVFDAMVETFKEEHKVILSFKNLNHCTTAFLNASIGKFLSNFNNPLEIKNKITFIELDTNSLINLKIQRVIENLLDLSKKERHDKNFHSSFDE